MIGGAQTIVARLWGGGWRIYEGAGIVVLNGDGWAMARLMHYCEVCGFEFERRGVTRHARSVLQQKGKLIRAMLERTCTTHAEIARRIGVTRERVRQRALQMGFATGRSRHAICRMER